MPRPSLLRPARLAVPAAVVALAVVAVGCGGSTVARSAATSRPTAGPEAGVTSHYGRTIGRPGQPTTLAAEAATHGYAIEIQADTASFVAAVDALQAHAAVGDTAAARGDELDAQTSYDAFRDLERGNSVNATTLDELATDVPPGTSFGGLHAVERDLWSGGPTVADAASVAAQAPVAQFLLSHLRLGPEAIGRVAVDELDWAVDVALPVSQEQVSHLGLVDVAATEAAAGRAFAEVAPLGRLVAPGLTATVAGQFAALDADVAALGPPRSTPDTAVTPAARLALSHRFDATATTLARLAARLAPYGTAGAPS